MMQPPMRRNPMQGNRMPMPGPPRPKGMQSYAANGKKPAVGIGDPDDDGDMDMPPAAAAPPTPDAGGAGAVLTLDQMGYHEDPHACSLCKHYDQGGNCEVAQQQVNPDGGCLVFSAQDDDSGGDMSGGQPSGAPGGMAPGGGAGMYGG